jgi:Domain of unknown function (DUF4390)
MPATPVSRTIGPVTLMDFFLPCWRNLTAQAAARCPYWRAAPRAAAVAIVVLLVLAGLLPPLAARADSPPAELSTLELERTDEGVFLSATMKIELPAVVDDVLRKGIPVFFVAEADLRRGRWYWYDKRILTTSRHMRLAYQPLLRRWRLQVASHPIGNNGLGVTLSQNFETLADALASIQRFSRWKIADVADLEADARYNVDFQFRLDVSQLPRPFQIGALGQTEWNLSVGRNQKVPVEVSR